MNKLEINLSDEELEFLHELLYDITLEPKIIQYYDTEKTIKSHLHQALLAARIKSELVRGKQ